VSQENVDFLLSVHLRAEVDQVPIFRDDRMWATVAGAYAPFADPDFEVVSNLFGATERFAGIDGYRRFMLDFIARWDAFRAGIERTIDLDDDVLVIYRSFGRMRVSTNEVAGPPWAVLWTFRAGKVLRVTSWDDHAEALKAVGLEE
jgi:hypothetical protein